MKLTFFGATGQTGMEIVKQALSSGHDVTVVARDPAKLGEFKSKVKVIQGDSTDSQVAEQAVAGADAVLSALGHVGNSPPDLLSKSISSIIDAMKKQNVKRLIVLTNVAARDPSDRPSFYNRVLLTLFTLIRGKIAKDSAEEARIISESDLDWTIVRAILLTNGPLTKKYRIGPFETSAKTRISRVDVADFMISCIVEGKYVRAKPVISEQ
jgi:putative NADH-flavin reductase